MNFLLRALRRLLCRVAGHSLPPGLTRRMTFRFTCARCGYLAAGDLSTSHR